MKTFVSGSISINSLPKAFTDELRLLKGQMVLVGDAYGADYYVQGFVGELQILVTVYTIKSRPRNRRSSLFTVKQVTAPENLPEKLKQQYKDVAMAEDCDCGLVLWDGKSYGSYCNILQLIKRGKPVKVFCKGGWIPETELSIENLQRMYKEGNRGS